jgi:hypothetical protein
MIATEEHHKQKGEIQKTCIRARGGIQPKRDGEYAGNHTKKKGKENPKIEERKTAAGKPIHTIQGSNHTHISQKEKRGKKKHTNTPIVPPAQPASNCQQQQTQWGHGIRNKTPIPNSGRGKQSKQPRVSRCLILPPPATSPPKRSCAVWISFHEPPKQLRKGETLFKHGERGRTLWSFAILRSEGDHQSKENKPAKDQNTQRREHTTATGGGASQPRQPIHERKEHIHAPIQGT